MPTDPGSGLAGYVTGVGLLGPGLADWDTARAVLGGAADWHPEPTVIPALTCLPSAERRRTGVPVKIALTAGLQACRNAGLDPATLPAVFTSSGGDGQNLHEMDVTVLEALAGIDGAVVTDPAGHLLTFGAILRVAPEVVLAPRAVDGARTTAALAASFHGPVLKVSEYGFLTMFLGGRRVWEL